METSSGQHILIKDQTKIKKAFRHTTVVINSRERNYLNYPNSNDFRYTLRRPLTNVLSIELINCSIPSYLYTIQKEWGSFSFQEIGSPVVSITLTPGFYTEPELCSELQTQLNAIPGKRNTYVVSQDPRTRIITITTTVFAIAFRFLFYSGSFKDSLDLNTLSYTSINTPARLLGFGYDDYASSTAGAIKGIIPMDLDNFLKGIYLHMEADGKNLDRMERSGGNKDCFHIFHINPGEKDYITLDQVIQTSLFESKPAPIARISNLQISLRDEFSRLLNINMRELTLILDITHLE